METVKEVKSAKERFEAESDITKGFKRRIIELVRNNPFESECDITDVVLGLKSLLEEFASIQTSELKAEIDTLQSELYSCRNKIERLERNYTHNKKTFH